eukprot:gene23695-29941_t
MESGYSLEAHEALPAAVKKKRGGQKKVKIEGEADVSVDDAASVSVKTEQIGLDEISSPVVGEKKTRGRRPNKPKVDFETVAPEPATQSTAVNPYATAKGKASRGSLNPVEVLKALFMELEGNGLQVFKAESRLSGLQVKCVRAAKTEKQDVSESIISECVEELISSAIGEQTATTMQSTTITAEEVRASDSTPSPQDLPASLLSLLNAFREGSAVVDSNSEILGEASRAMSISRAASTVASEYLTSFRDSLEEFDATFFNIKKDTIDRYRRKWDSLYSYNQHVNTPDVIQAAAAQAALETTTEGSTAVVVAPADSLLASNPFFGRKVPLEELPVSFDRIPNPFDNYGEDASRYDWLTSTSTVRSGLSSTLNGTTLVASQEIGALLSSPPKLARDISASQVVEEEKKVDLDSTTHPFIHHQSLYFGKAPLKTCMHSMFVDKVEDGSLLGGGGALPSFSALASSMSILNATCGDSQGQLENGVSTTSDEDEVDGEASLAQRTYARSLSNPETWPLAMKQCLGAAYSVLNLGLNPIIVDQQPVQDDENSFKAAVHRASIVATIICNYCGRNNEVKPVSAPSSDAVTTAGRRKSNTVTVVHENWGPVLVVVRLKDMADYEAALRLQCTNEFKLQVMSYYGNENDRTLLRSYIKGAGGGVGAGGSVRKGLYAERSHAHVVLINYESLLLDLHHFKDIFWFHIVFDEPWGLFANNRYTVIQAQLHNLLHSRQRLYVSGGLIHRQNLSAQTVSETVLPRAVDVTRNVFPYALGTLPVNNTTGGKSSSILENSIEYDVKCSQYLVKLLASLTCICPGEDETVSDAMSQTVFPLLAQLEWSGVEVQHNTEKALAATDCDVYVLNAGNEDINLLRHSVSYTGCYIDKALDRELRLIKMGAVGQPGNHARIMFDQEAADEYAAYTAASTNYAAEQSDANGAGRGGRGRGGRSGRGRSWKRGPDDEFGNYTTVSIETGLVVQGGARAAAAAGRGRGGGGRGPGSRGGRVHANAGRGRGRGRGGKGAVATAPDSSPANGSEANNVDHQLGEDGDHEQSAGEVEGDAQQSDMQLELQQEGGDGVDAPQNTSSVEAVTPSQDNSAPSSPSAMQVESPERQSPANVGQTPEQVEVVEEAGVEVLSKKRPFADVEQTTITTPAVVDSERLEDIDATSPPVGLGGDMASEDKDTNDGSDEIILPGKKPRRKSNPTANANYLYQLDGIDDDAAEVAALNAYSAAAKGGRKRKASEAAEASQRSDASPSQPGSSVNISGAVSATFAAATKAALHSKVALTFEQEREKSITHKGAVWQACIQLSGRTKFLGIFANNKQALLAFECAYRQREADMREYATYSPPDSHLRKMKGRGASSKEVRLLDGSYISSEYYKHMPTTVLLNEVASMASTQISMGHGLNEFISTNCPPPAYALLEGLHGYSVPVTYCNTVLGRASSRIHNLLVESLGDAEQGADGLQYQFRNSYNQSHDESHDHAADWVNHHVAVHIGFDASIADQHAVIVYNAQSGRFQITCISHAGLFLDGERIGSVIFYFLLPMQLNNIYMHSPLQQRENVLVSLLESVRLRDLHFRREEAARAKLNAASVAMLLSMKASTPTSPEEQQASLDRAASEEEAREEQEAQDEDKIVKAMQLYELLSVNCGYRVKTGQTRVAPPIMHNSNFNASRGVIPIARPSVPVASVQIAKMPEATSTVQGDADSC